MRKLFRRPSLSRNLYRWGIGAISIAGFAASSLFATDIPVTTINDSGAGSFREALAGALANDTISFNPSLNGLTLTNGQPLGVTTLVTLRDPVSITLTDPHAYAIASTLGIKWGGTLTLDGPLGDGSTQGKLISNGTGKVILAGANSYSGGTAISAGTVEAANSTAFGSGAVTISGASKLILDDGIALKNAFVLQSPLTLDIGTGSSQLTGALSGASSITLLGTGNLTLSGTNLFTGGLTINDASKVNVSSSAAFGTAAVTVSGAATLNLANSINISNAISLGNTLTAEVDSGTAGLQGIISGANPLIKTGAGTLILSGANTYSGPTTVEGGILQGNSVSLTTDIVLANNSTVVFNQLTAGTYNKAITGTGFLSKTGFGTLTFSGTSASTVATTVSAGELHVTGAINGAVGVTNPSATLSGTGSVGSVVNNGIVEPGITSSNTIGTLTVNGDFTQLSSGTTTIKINSGGNTPGTNSDYLNVTGQATLGGSLKVALQDAGSTAIQYTLLNASSVNGKYTQFYSDNPAYGVVMTYDPTDVKFQLQSTTDLRNAATTSNQMAVATVLENLKTDTTTSLYPTINMLGVESQAQQSQALTQLSGAIFGDLQTLGLLAGDEFHRRVTNRLVSNSTFLIANSPSQNQDDGVRGQSPSYVGGDPMRGWLLGYGSSGNLRSDGNASGLSFNQGGGVYGYDIGEDESGCFGLAIGNSHARFKDDVGASGLLSAYQFGTYALVHDDTRYLLGIVNYGYNEYSTNRNVTIADVNQTLHAAYSGSQIGANVEAGLKYTLAFLQIQPLVGMQYLYLCPQGFTESGGNDALTVLRSRANSLRAIVGARLAVDSFRGLGGTIWTPYSHARFVADMLDNDRIVNASFSGVPIGSAFRSQGTTIGQTYGILGEGLQVQLNETWSLFGGADFMFGDRISTATGAAGLMCLW